MRCPEQIPGIKRRQNSIMHSLKGVTMSLSTSWSVTSENCQESMNPTLKRCCEHLKRWSSNSYPMGDMCTLEGWGLFIFPWILLVLRKLRTSIRKTLNPWKFDINQVKCWLMRQKDSFSTRLHDQCMKCNNLLSLK